MRNLIKGDYSIEVNVLFAFSLIIFNVLTNTQIDKMRLAANEDLSTNRNNLTITIRSILDPIFDHPESIPPEIGALCRLLFRLTDKKFPGEGFKVLSGSLFLRFICPFIGSPKFWRLLTRQGKKALKDST